jgi:hypothetical protein
MPEVRHQGDDEELGHLMADVASRASTRLGYRAQSSPALQTLRT